MVNLESSLGFKGGTNGEDKHMECPIVCSFVLHLQADKVWLQLRKTYMPLDERRQVEENFSSTTIPSASFYVKRHILG